MAPIYRDALHPSFSERPHVGLWYDKFADSWLLPGEAAGLEGLAFQKQEWIARFAGRSDLWEAPLLDEVVRRQGTLALALGGLVLRLRNRSRFMTGLGRDHPLENGFAWHPILGTPYLPGSGLKGVLRAWRRLQREQGAFSAPSDRLMGEPGRAGGVAVLDLLPTAPPALVAEIMTPHYGPYYASEGDGVVPPSDWHEPSPIPLLAVEAGQSWQCAVVPVAGPRAPEDQQWRSLEQELLDALAWLGAGAKTAVGYGVFEPDRAATDRVRRELAEAAVQAGRRRRHHRALAGMTPMAAEFYRACEEGAWATGRDAFLREGLIESWLDCLESSPDPDVVQMLCELLERHIPGLLADPDRTQGRKGKPLFKERQRSIAHRLGRLRRKDRDGARG